MNLQSTAAADMSCNTTAPVYPEAWCSSARVRRDVSARQREASRTSSAKWRKEEVLKVAMVYDLDFGIEARCTVGGRCKRPERSGRPWLQCVRITQDISSVYQAAFDV